MDIEIERAELLCSGLDDACITIGRHLGIDTKDFYIVGGAVVSTILQEEIKDYDIVLKDGIDFNHDITHDTFQRYIEFDTSIGVIQVLTLRSYKANNTLSTEVLSHFDLEHTAVAYNYHHGLKYLYTDTIKNIEKKQLKVLDPVSPTWSVIRVFKFMQRGWTMLPSEQKLLMSKIECEELTVFKDEYDKVKGESR